MRALLHRTWWDLIVGFLAVVGPAILGAVFGGIAALVVFPIYAAADIFTQGFGADLGSRPDPIEAYINGLAVWVWVIVGTLTALTYLGHHVRADRQPQP